jgi:hypothetical protein
VTAVSKDASAAQVVLGADRLTIGGRPALIQAGTFHYFRLPHPDLWAPVLARMRMAGLNAVLVPLPWSYHSPAPGFYDFTGPRNLGMLFDEIERAGLWLMPHIGPWIGVDLDAGGVPAWALSTPGFMPACSSAVPPRPSIAFLRYVGAWWEHLLPLLMERPNLLMLAIDPGSCTFEGPWTGAESGWLHRHLRPLLDLVRQAGCGAPCAMPEVAYLQAGDLDGTTHHVLPFFRLTADGEGPVAGSQSAYAGLALLDLALPLSWIEGRAASPSHVAGDSYPRHRIAAAVAEGLTSVVLSPGHTGAPWGRWSTSGATALPGYGAAISGCGALSRSYYQARRMALTIESLGNILADGVRDPAFRMHPASSLRGVVSNEAGAVVWVEGVAEGEPFAQLLTTREEGPETEELVSLLEDIHAPPGSIALFPYAWRLSEGRLLATTLEPVLHTLVAGRELVILRNEAGGDVVLPPEFRTRNRRGPVYAERSEAGLSIHVDVARVASLVLDGPTGTLQLLALEPRLSERAWPLDDAWRKTPFYPASWHSAPEEPARGVVIGPDFVLPQENGGFRLLTSAQGFGYRWGPWRGSDPHTWLAPFTWEGPNPLSLPVLTWESRPGAPEAGRAYDDRSWRAVLPGAPLDMASHGIEPGFAWYRARITGTPAAVTVACRHACDLFLNGVHIAALNPPPDYGEPRPKTLPLPSRHLQTENVLAILVESEGRPSSWNEATTPYGLIMCDVEGGEVKSWRIREGLTGEVRVQGFQGYASWELLDDAEGNSVTWHRARFSLHLPPDHVAPLFLYLDETPAQCHCYLNGVLIQRLRYPKDLQRRFWLPDGLLQRRATNEILIAQWTRGAQPGIGTATLEAGTPLVWRREAGI